MALSPGQKFGPYEILGPLGAGGMGEVYRARDARLGRDVALKVLHDHVAASPDRLRRFEQEARPSGALSHPNVLTVFDVAREGETPYVVSELLLGETLRTTLRGGALPVRKALDYAGQIAAGLAAAHEKGIVHRDLKPENLFLTPEGRIKILDFGLAKLRGEPSAESEGETTATEPGIFLGTVGYMSPEQARGAVADHRSDMFSLGVVLYEMLRGQRPFKRETSADTLAAILKEDPPELAAIRPEVPPVVERIVRRCLEKRPEDRFHSAHDLGLALEATSAASSGGRAPTSGESTGTVAKRSPGLRTVVSLGLALFLLALGALGQRHLSRPAPVPSYRQLTFRHGTVTNARFAADGQTVAYSARWEGKPSAVFTQRLDAPGAPPQEILGGHLVAVQGGEMAVSRDDDTLVRVALSGGTPRELAKDVVNAEWTAGDEWAIARWDGERGLLEWPKERVIRRTDPRGLILSPRVSAQGDALAFFESRARQYDASVAVADRQGAVRVLSRSWYESSRLAFSPDGREVWFSASREGTARILRAVDLAGRERVVARLPGSMGLEDISADGRVLVSHGIRRAEALGLLAGDESARDLTWAQNTWVTAVSDDGRTILFQHLGEFASGVSGPTTYLRRTGDPAPVRLGDGQGMDLSRDGSWAVSIAGDPGGQYKVLLLPTGPGEPRLLRLGSVEVFAARFTPDGRRLVLSGREAGRPYRLFVQELPDGLPRAMSPEGLADLFAFVVTPDGSTVAARPSGPNPSPFVLYPIEGGEPRPIPGLKPTEFPLRWSNDGRFLFLLPISASPGAWAVARLDTKTGVREAWLQAELPDRAGVEQSFMVITPDGRHWAASYQRDISDLYLVDGLR